MEKKSGEMVNDGLEFFKVTTSALEVNLFRLFKYYSFKLTRMFVVCSVQWKKLWSCILKISIDYLPWAWKKKLLLWKKVWKKTWILDPKICTNPVLTSVPLTFESLSSSEIWHTTGSNPVIDKYPTRSGGGGGVGKGVLRLLSNSNQRYRVTIRPCVPPLVCLNFIARLLSAPTFVYLLTFEFGCSKGEWR